jgi:hypothetical protein
MKAQILKIAGVKSEKEFYKKYPSEEAFMKQHGKAFKKAQMGTIISGGDKTLNPKMIALKDFYDQADMDVTGMTDEMRQKQLVDQAAIQSANPAPAAGGGGGDAISSILGQLGGGAGGSGGLMSMLSGGGGGSEGLMSMLGGARYGADIPRAQVGWNGAGSLNYGQGAQTYAGPQQQPLQSVGSLQPAGLSQLPQQGPSAALPTAQQLQGGPEQSGLDSILGGISKYAGPVGKIYEGFQALGKEKTARRAAEQQKAVSDITLKASESRPEQIKRKYVRPEDIQNTGEEFFPIYGVGTNVLARNGVRLEGGGMIGGNPTEIQNTYNDGYDIYTDGGYEPLNDSNQVKSFYHGGRLHSMQDGGGMSPDMYGQISGIATNIGQTAMGGQNAGGNIGSTIGGTAGTLIGGPIGGAIGGFVGGIAGNALDTNGKRMKKAQAATQRNITKMGLNSGFQSLNAGNSSYVRDGGDIANYEDGGYMNPEYNPQVITMFGDVNAQDFADYAHKDEFRAGGHLKSYTPPSERAMETYEDGGGVKSYGLGGELQTHWGGGAETISQNPYLPGSGETVMFRGKSHEEYSPNGETGIGVTYGGNPVEVERGEPMVELEEGGVVDPETGEVQKSGVVFGNLKIPNQYIDLLGDKSAKGKKFKNYVADLSKGEEKQNRLIEKSTSELDGFEPLTSFDKLKMTALQANIQGANMKLKDIADKKINAAHLQNAINDTAEENGLVADDLARGKVKIDKEAMQTREARWGDAISKAANGKTVTTETTKFPTSFKDDAEAKSKGFTWTGKYGPDGKSKEYKRTLKTFSDKESETKDAKALGYVPTGQKYDPKTGLHGKLTPAMLEEAKKANSWYPGWSTFDPKKKADVLNFQKAFNARAKANGSSARITEDGAYGEETVTARIEENKKSTHANAEEEYIATVPGETSAPPAKGKTRFPWEIYANQALNYLRPSDQEALDMAQLYPEMYAMSSNQLEPVPAQGYQPEIGVPYDISLQDQLNANQADYRAMQRISGYNPAAQANLNAQKYQANQQVLGNQFRANQEMKDKVYGENRQILNQAKLTNLGIYDTQYQRQAQALSNTKATTQAALNSISDKYAKNKLENRILGVYENMYNYRFGKSGRAQNWNGLQFFDTTVGGDKGNNSGKGLAKGKGFSYDENGNIVGIRSLGKDEDEEMDALEAAGKTPGIVANKKNGGPVKKNYKNSSVVRAYKNL